MATVGDDGEFGLIGRITARFPATAAVQLGPGDDAAVIAAPDGRVVATTDLMVEGRHFRRDWSSAYDVGRKSAASNLADVVAMGARPTALLVGLAAPGDLPVEWAEGLADGLRDECARLGATVAGGDLVRADTITVAVTALGDLEGRAPLTRAAARPGDDVVLIGQPGRAAAGLAQLLAGDLNGSMVTFHRRPEPLYDLALTLAASGLASTMIDLSDGLVADLGHVALASGVRIALTAGALPSDPGIDAAAAALDRSGFDWVASGGDDHCFAGTVRAGSVATLPGLIRIGTVLPLPAGERAAVSFTDRDTPALGGHEHFRS